MRSSSTSEYKGYLLTVVVVPQEDRSFTSMFALDKGSERVHILTRSAVAETDPVFHSTLVGATRFPTLDSARKASEERGRAWIDAVAAAGCEVRHVSDTTTGDFLSFELFVGGRWRDVRISGTALAVLDKGANSVRFAIFEQHLETIIQSAASKALADLDAPYILLTAPL